MRLFLDTSALVALEDTDDRNHSAAIEYREKIQQGETIFRRLYTSNYVLDEVLAILRLRCGHRAAVAFRETMELSKAATVLWIDKVTENNGWQIFRKHGDKDFSFTDCTSFALMEREMIRTAFTFDRDFLQYGFETVP